MTGNSFEVVNQGPGEALLMLARRIIEYEPGLSVYGAGDKQTLLWVPPSDEPFEEHLELRETRLRGKPSDLNIRQVEFVIAGDDEEMLLVDAEQISNLDDDPYVEYFRDRYSGIFARHLHALCKDPVPQTRGSQLETPRVALRSAATGQPIKN